MNFKKFVWAGLVAIMALVLVHSSVYAQMDKTKPQTQMRTMSQARQMFIDENGDGICDTRMDKGKIVQDGNHAGMMDDHNVMDGHDEMMKDHKNMRGGMIDGSMNGMTNGTMRHQMRSSGTGMNGGMGSMGKGGMHG